MPPDCAIAIANLDSVTVSIAEDIKGIFKYIFFVNKVLVSALLGRTEEAAGLINTSSKVKASTNFNNYLSSFNINSLYTNYLQNIHNYLITPSPDY